MASDKHLKDALTETAALTLSLVRSEMREMEKRLRDDIQKPSFDYRGVWRAGENYPKGVGVTHDGSMFIALRDSPEVPGKGINCGWQLCVKRGRNGR